MLKTRILTGSILGMLMLQADGVEGGGSTATATQVDLKNLDYCIAVDGSGSMGAMSGAEGNYPDRYTASKETVKGLVAEMAAIDTDGISACIFGETAQFQDGLDYAKFAAMFDARRPSGGTLIIPLLTALFAKARESMAKGKQFLAQIIWDGAPNELDSADRQSQLDTIGKMIAAFTQEMTSDGQVAIQFLQVGNASDEKIAAFNELLDDQLVSKYGAKFDCIDCKPLSWVNTQGTMQAVANEAFNG